MTINQVIQKILNRLTIDQLEVTPAMIDVVLEYLPAGLLLTANNEGWDAVEPDLQEVVISNLEKMRGVSK